MAIEFVCPTCNGTLRVGDETAGRVVRCGACRTMLRVPGLARRTRPGSRRAARPVRRTRPGRRTRPRVRPTNDRAAEPPAAAEPVERPRAGRSWIRLDNRRPPAATATTMTTGRAAGAAAPAPAAGARRAVLAGADRRPRPVPHAAAAAAGCTSSSPARSGGSTSPRRAGSRSICRPRRGTTWRSSPAARPTPSTPIEGTILFEQVRGVRGGVHRHPGQRARVGDRQAAARRGGEGAEGRTARSSRCWPSRTSPWAGSRPARSSSSRPAAGGVWRASSSPTRAST